MDENEIKDKAPIGDSEKKKDIENAEPKKKKFSMDFKAIKMPTNLKALRMNKKYIWIAVGVVLAIALIFRGIGNIKNVLFKPKKEEVEDLSLIGEVTPVKVYKIKRIDFKDTLPVMGTIKGYKEVGLKFQTSGILESFNFEEWEKIQEGDIIANLEQKDALLKLKYAELELNTAKKLLEVGAIVEDALEKTRLEYESARSDLEKTNIYAVSDGVLGSHDLDVGTYVTPNDKIGTFADITKVYAEFDIIEKDAPKLKLGQKSEIFVDALPNKNFVGTVDTISPLIEGRTRTQRVKVELKNPESVLYPGMFTRGLISTYEKKNAIIVPASGLKKKEEGYVVFVVHRDKDMQQGEETDAQSADAPPAIGMDRDTGVIEIRLVQVAYMTQDRVEIGEGLQEGELIVMELYQELQDQEKVEVAEVQEILY